MDEALADLQLELIEWRQRFDEVAENSREKSIVLTKIDEARLWLGEI